MPRGHSGGRAWVSVLAPRECRFRVSRGRDCPQTMNAAETRQLLELLQRGSREPLIDWALVKVGARAALGGAPGARCVGGC